MYKIGDTIVYSDGKIYSIVDKLERDYGRGPQMYFELKQNDLSKTSEFLTYYALPYIPNPQTHPNYMQLFTHEWINELKDKIKTTIHF